MTTAALFRWDVPFLAMGDTADGKRRSFALDARQQKLFDENQSLVGSAVIWALYSLPRHLDIDVIRGAALRGLMKAARDFQPSRGVSFFTYAANPVRGRIYGEIRDELREMDFFKGVRRSKTQLLMKSGDALRVAQVLVDESDQISELDARDAVAHLISKLSPIDQRLIQWGYLDTPPKSFVEIAQLLDVHYSRVSQRMKEIRHKLFKFAKQAGM